MGRTILLERRQNESVGRRNSRTTFLRSDWPRPATPFILTLMNPLLLQQAKLTTPATSYFQDRERRIESSIQSFI
ncbi:hypothetical protein TNCV_4186671 [Trichonephila clavipes]|nr:hypothetical protein TNCV_4186671 [Trichonephila clavipes]